MLTLLPVWFPKQLRNIDYCLSIEPLDWLLSPLEQKVLKDRHCPHSGEGPVYVLLVSSWNYSCTCMLLQVLPWSSGGPASVRHCEASYLWERRALVEGATGPCWLQHCHHVSGEQVWSQASEGSANRRGEGIRRYWHPLSQTFHP